MLSKKRKVDTTSDEQKTTVIQTEMSQIENNVRGMFEKMIQFGEQNSSFLRHCVGEMDTELVTLMNVNIQNKLKSDEFEKKIFELINENKQLKVENEELDDEQKKYHEKSESLISELKQVKVQEDVYRKSFLDEKSAHQSSKTKLENEHKLLNIEIKKLIDEKSDHQSSMAKLEDENRLLFSKNEQLGGENVKLYELMRCQSEQLKQAKIREDVYMKHLEDEKSDHHSIKTKLEDEKMQLFSKIEQLGEEKRKWDEQLKQANEERSDLQSSKSKLEDEIKQLFSKAEQLGEEKSKLYDLIGCQAEQLKHAKIEQDLYIKHLKDEKSNHQRTKTKLDDENKQLLSRFEQLRKDQSKHDDPTRCQIELLQKQAKNQEDIYMNHLKDEKNDHQSTKTNLEDKNNQLLSKIEQLNMENSKLMQEVSHYIHLQYKNGDLHSSKTKLENENTQLEEKNRKIEDEKKQLLSIMEEKSEENEQLYNANKQLDDKVELLRQKLNELKTLITEKESNIEHLKEAAEEYSKDYENLKIRLDEKDACIENLKKEMDEQIVLHKKMFEDSQTELTKCVQKKKELRKALHERGASLRNMKEDIDAMEIETLDKKSCKICLEDDISVAFLPCGHLCCCRSCASRPEVNICPICRVEITDTLRIFQS